MANRHLSIASIIEKNRIASDVAWLALLEVDVKDPATGNVIETLRLARNDEDFTFEGNVYSKGWFDLDVKQEAGSQPEVKINAVDYTRTVQQRMQQYGGGIGFTVRILAVNTANTGEGSEANEQFTVVRASQQDFAVSFTLGAENPLTLRFPRRVQFRNRCPWKYKGAECAYSGSLPTCDFSLTGANGCIAHGNENRFGGFPGIQKRR